jgi:thiol-disulfide isomerase/thioredoxin
MGLALFGAPAASADILTVGGIENNFAVVNHTSGATVHLTDFAEKVVVLDYFAYWCGWCAIDSPLTETDIQQYYEARGGNAHGVPVQVLSISVDQTNPAATTSFIANAGIELATDDILGQAWAQNDTNELPTYVVLNGVVGAAGMKQWQVLYTVYGYPGPDPLRQAIDSVVPPVVNGPPAITTQPVSQTMAAGSTVVFTVSCGDPVSYQWTFKGVNLSDGNGVAGSNGPQLVLQGVGAGNYGNYACVVTDLGGSTKSTPATLQVASVGSPAQVSSLSARAFVGTGDNLLIGGFYIVGSTSATVLVQAIGPALAASPYNVSGTLQRPTLAIHQYQNGNDVVLYLNTGWGSSPVLSAAAAAAYAQPVLQPSSNDSELLVTLPPGGYTAEVYGADGGTGVALCAIYQLP